MSDNEPQPAQEEVGVDAGNNVGDNVGGNDGNAVNPSVAAAHIAAGINNIGLVVVV